SKPNSWCVSPAQVLPSDLLTGQVKRGHWRRPNPWRKRINRPCVRQARFTTQRGTRSARDTQSARVGPVCRTWIVVRATTHHTCPTTTRACPVCNQHGGRAAWRVSCRCARPIRKVDEYAEPGSLSVFCGVSGSRMGGGG